MIRARSWPWMTLWAVLLCSPAPVGAADLPEITGETLSVGDLALERTGRGTRSLAFIDVYRCALYLPRRIGSIDEMMPDDVPVAIVIEVLVNDPPDEMPDRWRATLREEITDRAFKKLKRAYRQVAMHDRLVFLYRPGTGTDVILNENALFTDPGKGLMNGLLEQWLGDKPVSESLRTALMSTTR